MSTGSIAIVIAF